MREGHAHLESPRPSGHRPRRAGRAATLPAPVTNIGRRWLGDLALDNDAGQIVNTALALAETKDAEGQTRTPAERRADALHDISQHYLDNHTKPASRRHRPHVTVVLRPDQLDHLLGGASTAEYLDGSRPNKSIIEAMLCDATWQRAILTGQSEVLDLGHSTKDVSAAIWAALVVRDGGCRFGACDRQPKWCDAHHVQWFSKGGTTSITNTCLLCRYHHTLIHKPGWHAKLLPDATLEITDPNGRTRTTRPPGTLAVAC